jgi:putative membrane protein
LAVWGGLGLVSQLAVFFVVWLLIPGLKTGMNEDNLAYGVLLGALSIAMGILNAGALSI